MLILIKISVGFLRRPGFFKMLLGVFLALFLAACGPATAPPTASPAPTRLPSPTVSMDCAPGRHVNELVSGGETRHYILHVPASYIAGKPVALVLGFHGNGGHAEQFESYSGFSPLAEREGFIVVYPQGFGEEHPTWDVWEGSKDVQFTRGLIDKIMAICSIDPTRIYATGHSLGGGMVNRLACDLSERIAAIGPVSGAYVNPEPCSPSQPVAVVSVHGTADTNVFYNGFPPGGNSPETYSSLAMPIPQWASTWARHNGCSAKSSVFFRKDPVSGQQWGNCLAGADVVLYTIRDGEHGWPTSNASFDAAQAIWDFFSQHPLALAPGG